MSNWNAFINRLCTQTAVYWGEPVSNGMGGKTFTQPVEVKVRWEKVLDLEQEDKGEQEIPKDSAAVKILCTRVLEMDGYLYLGTLASLSGDITNPVEVDGAYRINNVGKIPLINGKDFINEYQL